MTEPYNSRDSISSQASAWSPSSRVANQPPPPDSPKRRQKIETSQFSREILSLLPCLDLSLSFSPTLTLSPSLSPSLSFSLRGSLSPTLSLSPSLSGSLCLHLSLSLSPFLSLPLSLLVSTSLQVLIWYFHCYFGRYLCLCRCACMFRV